MAQNSCSVARMLANLFAQGVLEMDSLTLYVACDSTESVYVGECVWD